ncbi:MAG: cupin domain-containing protein [Sandaracinaceae bacterium]|nr:cupin domain-containing protein [Sandaracinaceae bacterium]
MADEGARSARSSAGPLRLAIEAAGEEFVFVQSAHGPEGTFRFRWTLGPKKKGPPPHLHPHEAETFRVVSGKLQIWLDGVRHDCGPGDEVTAPRGVMHRFFNPGDEPVIVDVSLDGGLQEASLVGLAEHARRVGRPLRLGEMLRQTVVQFHRGAIGAPGLVGAMVRGTASLLVALGVRGYEPTAGWDA